MPIITLQFDDDREGRENARQALEELGGENAPVFPGVGSHVWIDGATYPLWENYDAAIAALPALDDPDDDPEAGAPTGTVQIVRVSTRETSAEFDLSEIEQMADATLAQAGSLDDLVEAAKETLAGLSIHDRLDKYEEVTDSTAVNRWKH